MKIHWHILSAISIMWMGCGSIEDSSDPVRPEPTPSGMYIHPVTKQPFDGVYDVVENGERLRMEIKSGLKTGLWQRWYPNSKKLKSEWNLVKNQRHGLQRNWYPTGQLMMEANFRKGLCLNAKTWNISGAIASTVVDGTGSMVLFRTDGSKRRESIYKDGLKVN